jgi:cyclase
MRSAAAIVAVVAGVACTAAARAPVVSRPSATLPLPPLPLPTEPASFREVKLADGVYAFIAPPETPVVSGNSLVVIGDDGVLVVDTQQFPKVARWEIAAIERLTSQPVRYVVNTHWHNDHWLGNADFVARWPHAMILATPSTRALAHDQGLGYLDTKGDVQQIADLRAQLARGTRHDGGPLSADQRTYLTTAADQLAAYVDALRGVTPVLPTATFRDEIVVHLGAREVHVAFLGRGNTGGDAVVFVPDVKVVATGDLLVAPVPFASGAFIGEWPATLRRVQALGATTIVPGHGLVQHDARHLARVIGALESITSQVRAARAAGRTLDQTRALVDVKAFEAAMCGDDAWCHLAFAGTFVAPAVERAYREAGDGPLHDED